MRRFTRKLWALLAVLALAVAGMTMTAAPASAATNTAATTSTLRMCPAIYPMPEWCKKPLDQYRTAGPTYIGWTYLNLNYCPPGMACAAVYRSSTAAWRWTGTAWQQASLPGGWVYVYPYTGQWRWAWTQQTGWLAINTGRFEIR